MTNCVLATARKVLLLVAHLSSIVALLSPTTARAQPAEARCGSPGNPLATYIVRVDCLDTIHAKDAIEVSKDGQICAATAAEARAWQSVLETARDRMRREVQTAAETTKARITAARALWSDAEELRRSICWFSRISTGSHPRFFVRTR